MYWLQNNEDNPARKIVEGLLKDYDRVLHSKLDRYYNKAMSSPADRSTASVSTRATKTSSQHTRASSKTEKSYATLSHTSRQLLDKMRAQYQEQIVDLRIEHNAILRSKEEAERNAEKLKRDILETKNRAAIKQQKLMEEANAEKKRLGAQVAEHEVINARLEQELRTNRDHTALQEQKMINKAEKEKQELEIKAATQIKEIKIAAMEADKKHKREMAALTSELRSATKIAEAHMFPDAEDVQFIGDFTDINSMKMDPLLEKEETLNNTTRQSFSHTYTRPIQASHSLKTHPTSLMTTRQSTPNHTVEHRKLQAVMTQNQHTRQHTPQQPHHSSTGFRRKSGKKNHWTLEEEALGKKNHWALDEENLKKKNPFKITLFPGYHRVWKKLLGNLKITILSVRTLNKDVVLKRT